MTGHRRFDRIAIVYVTVVALVCLAGLIADAPAQQRDLLALPKAKAGSIPIEGEYWAMLVGIDDYQNAPKLQTAVKDVTGIRDILVTRYGFTLEKVSMLINGRATRTNIEHELYNLSQLAKPDDSVLIYYAGHGQYDEEGRLGWWVPVEGEPRNPGTFITNASIRDYIEGMKARHVYLVADSCFSGTLFGKSRGLPPINDQFYARLYSKRSRWGLTSGGTEPVADQGKGGHSIFAYHFITLLRENLDPYLIPSAIYDRIAPSIANNADQTPRSEPLKGAGDEGGQFIFRLAVPVSTAGPNTPKSGASAALLQAEQELKSLEQQERVAEDEEKLAILQQQIQEKKKRVEEKRKQVGTRPKQAAPEPERTQEARARPPYDAPRQKSSVMDAIHVEASRKGLGVAITDIEPDSAAETAGLQVGDVIQEVNREVIQSVDHFHSLSAKAPRRGPVLLLVNHNGTFRFVALKGR